MTLKLRPWNLSKFYLFSTIIAEATGLAVCMGLLMQPFISYFIPLSTWSDWYSTSITFACAAVSLFWVAHFSTYFHKYSREEAHL